MPHTSNQPSDRARRADPHTIIVVDNHDAAYAAWRDAGVRGRTLVHVDAHHDLGWLAEDGLLTIANFISPAMREGIVGDVFWVVPDPTWERAADRRAIVKQVRRLQKCYPPPRERLVVEHDRLTTRLIGRSITVCPLEALPRLEGHALLDIDIDYLVVAHVYGESDAHRTLPWRWPADLLARLGDRGVESDLVTIARSVEGGYTPLVWEYLSDDLAARLAGDADRAAAFDVMRQAAVFAQAGDMPAAEEHYLLATKLLPNSAAPLYHRALLCLRSNRPAEARYLWREAVARNPSYRTPFNTSGLSYYNEGRFEEARDEYERALALDEDDAYAQLGLGRLAAHEGRWEDAERALMQAIRLEPNLVDAHRAMGYVHDDRGRVRQAIASYEHSLKLTLLGCRPIGHVVTTTAPRQMLDPSHGHIHARLGRLYEREGDRVRAIASYRMGIASGHQGVVIRARLARLYFASRQWRRALAEACRAVIGLPRDVIELGMRWMGTVRETATATVLVR